jgi:hypothetical protein
LSGINGLRHGTVSGSPYDPRSQGPGGQEEAAERPDSRIERAVAATGRNTAPAAEPKDPPPPPGPQEPEHSTEVVKPTAAPPPEAPEPVVTRVEPPPDGPLAEALRCYREDRADEAPARLQQLDPAAREVLLVLLPLAAKLEKAKLADLRPRHLAAVLDQLDRLTQPLRPRAALTLEKMCFCRSIEQFGVYDPLPSSHTYQAGVAGQPGDLVQVYVELRNFTTQAQGDTFTTALATSLQLHDCDQPPKLVWREDRPARVERSRSRRHDCFLNCHFYVPPRLPTGDYVLTIQVRDVTGSPGPDAPGHRVATRTLDLRVRGYGSSQATH